MGEMADYYSDPCADLNRAFFEDSDDFGDSDLSYEDWVQLKKILGPSETVWQTKEGKNIPVVEMTDAHIINTILMLERNEATNVATYPTLLTEARKRKLTLNELVRSEQ